MDFKQLFDKTDNAVKLQFLKEALQKNEALRNQFAMYCHSAKTTDGINNIEKKPEKIISEAFKKMKAELESLDFENIDWSDYVPRHSGYIPEYEAVDDMAEDQLNDLFSIWKNPLQDLILNGQMLRATCELLGAYDACFVVDIPGGDDIFGDMTSELLQRHHLLLLDLIHDAAGAVTSAKQAAGVAEALFSHYHKKHRGMQDYLKHFEPWMINVAGDRESAELIHSAMQKNSIAESLLPGLVVKLYSYHDDPEAWVRKSEQFIYDDLDVARQLLSHYWLHAPGLFLEHGKKLFKMHPYELCDFFRERLFPMFDQEFFTDVLRYETIHKRSVVLYEELREYLDDAGKQKFIDEVREEDVFWVRVLAMEQRFDEILAHVKKEFRHTWHFTELISPILNIFPLDAFDMITQNINYAITHEKGRDTYRRVCEWLQLAQQIKQEQDNVKNLIQTLYNRKPALPALKEEMRKAGVVG